MIMKKNQILLIVIIALILEMIVFNITSYYTLLGKKNIKTYDNPELIQYDGDFAVLKLDDINCKTYSVKLNLKPIDNTEAVRIYSTLFR
jgi:hypothetical protein